MEITIKLEMGGGLAEMLGNMYKDKYTKKPAKPTDDEVMEAQMVFGQQVDSRHIAQIRKRRKSRGEYATSEAFNAKELIGLAETMRMEEEEDEIQL